MSYIVHAVIIFKDVLSNSKVVQTLQIIGTVKELELFSCLRGVLSVIATKIVNIFPYSRVKASFDPKVLGSIDQFHNIN